MIVIFVAFISLSLITIILGRGLQPNIVAQSEAYLKNTAISIMNKAVNQTLTEVGDTSSLIHVEKDSYGHVAYITADSTVMNRIAVKCALNAQNSIAELCETTLSIPLGNVLGSKLFSGMGPKIRIRVKPSGAVGTRFHTEFESVGINQSRYKVYIILEASMVLVVGTGSHRVQVETQVLISDVIMVGDVPQTYANVSEADGFMNLIP